MVPVGFNTMDMRSIDSLSAEGFRSSRVNGNGGFPNRCQETASIDSRTIDGGIAVDRADT